jgi:hypothetical protein
MGRGESCGPFFFWPFQKLKRCREAYCCGQCHVTEKSTDDAVSLSPEQQRSVARTSVYPIDELVQHSFIGARKRPLFSRLKTRLCTRECVSGGRRGVRSNSSFSFRASER